MLAVRWLAPRVLRQTSRIADGKLLSDAAADDFRHLCRPRHKRAQEPRGGQLRGEPEPVVIAATSFNQPAVALVEVKEPLQRSPTRAPSS